MTTTVEDDEDDDYDDEDEEADSDDDDDDENEESEEDDDDDDEESSSSSSSSFVDELRSAWKQHSIAVVVAVAATAVMHYYMNNSSSVFTYQTGSEQQRQRQHAHLYDYQRTSNVSFCSTSNSNNLMLIDGNNNNNNKELSIMDFNLPKELAPFMEYHYAADVHALQQKKKKQDNGAADDESFIARFSQSSMLLKKNGHHTTEEFECLQHQLNNNTTKTFIKGMSFYYKTPTIQSMYRNSNSKPQSSDDDDDELMLTPADDEEKELNMALATGTTKTKKTENSRQLHHHQPVHLTFTGFAVKVVNLSKDPVLLYWDGSSGTDDDRRLIGEVGPFDSLGTAATSAGQSFSVTPVHDTSHHLTRWIATADSPVLYHEPTQTELELWKRSYIDSQQREQHEQRQEASYWTQYQIHALNKAFAKEYLIATKGRHWLAHFPRPLPVHEQRPADYLGQEHIIDIAPSSFASGSNSTKPKLQQQQQHSLKLEVVSVLPRVFVIDDFLSPDECREIQQLAATEGLQPSTLQAGSTRRATTSKNGKQQHQQQQPLRDPSTRSSSNTWLERGDSDGSITDIIYRRAASVLGMDESLLQKHTIHDNLDAHEHSLAESLQVVRYRKGEQYTPHHDFVYPPTMHRYQPTRFATLLLYLNDNFTGGETVFPRAVQTQYHDGIQITPHRGRAVLFYNMLPDGNMNDLSQHASKPVEKGEKWLANRTYIYYMQYRSTQR